MRRMVKLLDMTRHLGLAALLLLASAAAVPQQAVTRYNVEIVVFRTASLVGALPDTAPREVVGSDAVESTAVTTRKLGSAANRLRNAGGYRILAHTAWAQAPTGWNSRRGLSAAQLGIERAGITGKVFLERGEYLNLRIDLTVEDAGRRYHLSEVRRVKANETQYFDHPAIGVLAMVTAGS
jgi:hypothetical protein